MTSSGWTGRCARWWPRASVMRAQGRAGAALALALLLAGCSRAIGTGEVRADFLVQDCPPGEVNGGLEDYHYDAGFLGTARFQGSVTLQIFKHRSLPEETDGLAVRLDLNALQQSGVLVLDQSAGRLVLASSPTALPVAFQDPVGAEVNLSLFGTCPDFPTMHGVAGTVTFDELRFALDPEGTGIDERVVGTLTASVARGTPLQVVGRLDAAFEFEVPKRPLMTFE